MTVAPPKPKMGRKKRADAPPLNDPNAWHNKIGRLIERKAKDRSLTELAEAAGMSKQAFHRLVKGHVADPQLSTLTAILKAIGATLAEFERA